MEYFLPLSVMAMIISSISIFLIDYKKPTTSTDSENDQLPSNPTDSMGDSADDFFVDKHPNQPQNDASTDSGSEGNALSKYQSTSANLKEQTSPFSMLWTTTPESNFSTSNF